MGKETQSSLCPQGVWFDSYLVSLDFCWIRLVPRLIFWSVRSQIFGGDCSLAARRTGRSCAAQGGARAGPALASTAQRDVAGWWQHQGGAAALGRAVPGSRAQGQAAQAADQAAAAHTPAKRVGHAVCNPRQQLERHKWISAGSLWFWLEGTCMWMLGCWLFCRYLEFVWVRGKSKDGTPVVCCKPRQHPSSVCRYAA